VADEENVMAIRAEHAGGDNVRLTITQGQLEVSVVEEHEDLRRFWHELGKVLNLANAPDLQDT
jgi:hypothetical protein